MINRILSFLLLGSLTFLVQGQNFVYSPSTHVDGQITAQNFEFNITVGTPNNEAITYKWEKIENSLLGDWDYSLCDYDNCYVGIPENGTMKRISETDAQGGKKGFFKLAFLSTNTDGKGVVKVYVYDSADYNRGDTVTFTLRKGLASVNSASSKSIKITPNPSTSEVNFQTTEANTQFQLVDVQGKVIKDENLVEAGTHQLMVADLPNGVYFLKFRSEGVLRQSKLIVQH